jgi:hypothetical protein
MMINGELTGPEAADPAGWFKFLARTNNLNGAWQDISIVSKNPKFDAKALAGSVIVSTAGYDSRAIGLTYRMYAEQGQAGNMDGPGHIDIIKSVEGGNVHLLYSGAVIPIKDFLNFVGRTHKQTSGNFARIYKMNPNNAKDIKSLSKPQNNIKLTQTEVNLKPLSPQPKSPLHNKSASILDRHQSPMRSGVQELIRAGQATLSERLSIDNIQTSPISRGREILPLVPQTPVSTPETINPIGTDPLHLRVPIEMQLNQPINSQDLPKVNPNNPSNF